MTQASGGAQHCEGEKAGSLRFVCLKVAKMVGDLGVFPGREKSRQRFKRSHLTWMLLVRNHELFFS